MGIWKELLAVLFQAMVRHFFGNRLGLARNSFKRYIIPTEKDEIENYYYNVLDKPYRTLTIPFEFHLISLKNSENMTAVKPSIKHIMSRKDTYYIGKIV